MVIAIINYGLGNLSSVAGAIERLGYKYIITNKKEEIRNSDKFILPGVGAFAEGMQNIKNLELDKILNEVVLEHKKPILGICLGFHMMAHEGFEFGHHAGLGWLEASVIKFEIDKNLRLPHVGWNDLFMVRESKLFYNIPEDALFYYVHSYHMKCKMKEIVTGECLYGERFTSTIENNNVYGTQFHPEKSQKWGLQLLRNFVEMA